MPRNPTVASGRTPPPAFSLIELLIAMAILTLTTTVAVTVFNPQPHRESTARLQLEQLKNALETHNSRNLNDYVDSELNKLSGLINVEQIEDPWGNRYKHNYGGGFVYSFGPDGVDDAGKGDDIVVYYRPPTASVVARGPVPSSTTDTAAPLLYADWGMTQLREKDQTGTANAIEKAVFFVDGRKFDGLFQKLDAPAIDDPGGDRDRWRTSYQVPANERLSDGKHTVRIEIVDAAKKPARAAWLFTVDTQPPSVFSLNPTNGASLTAPPTLISALFSDPAGINLGRAYFKFSGGDPVFTVEHDVATQGMPTVASGINLTQQSLRYTPPSTLPEGSYTAEVRVVDGVWSERMTSSEKGRHEKSATWRFTLEDRSAPQVAILQPAYGTTVTTSDDLVPASPATVELDVIGTADPSRRGIRETQIELRIDPGSSSSSQPVTATGVTTMADSSGRFLYSRVSVGGSNQTSSTLWVRAVRIKKGVLDARTYSNWLPTLVKVYNRPEDAVLVSARAEPTTTEPNRPVTLYFQVDRGQPPFDYKWDFGDGQQQKGVRDALGPVARASADDDPKTTGVEHSYLTTGTFNALVTVTDARGLSAGQLIPIYVGTESEVPKVSIVAEPFAFRYTIDPNAAVKDAKTSTYFNVRIEGKFLGEWRLKVQDKPTSVGAQFQKYVWFHNKDEINPVEDGIRGLKSPSGAPGPLLSALQCENDPPHGSTWNATSSNSFRIRWTGRDNTLMDDANRVDGIPTVVAFPGNVLDTSSPFYSYTAVLEYKDAFSVDGTVPTTSATCPVQVFNTAPAPGNMRIVSVEGDPYSLRLFDADNDGRPDFTNSEFVDLAIDRPVTTNTSDLWISNYPLDLRWIRPEGVEVDTNVPPLSIPASEIPSDTPGGYVFFDWTFSDGRSMDLSDGSSGWIPLTYLNFKNWPLTAGSEKQNSPGWGKPETGTGQYLPFRMGDKNSGLNNAADGVKTISVIFRSAGPFISTELDYPSLNFTKGVTSTSIFFDRSPPVAMAPTRIVKVQVDQKRNQSIIATIVTSATDTGSGMAPKGKIKIRTCCKDQIGEYTPYATTFTHNFGPVSALPSDGKIRAFLQFSDNLGNESVPTPCTTDSCRPALETEFSQASASLTSFTWSIIGSGDLTFFRTRDRFPVVLGLNEINASSPLTEHWRRNGAKLPSGTKYEDAFVSDAPEFLTVENFPNPDDRLGFLISRAPNASGNDNETNFPVDNQHRYFLALVKGPAEVEYRVFEVPIGVSISEAASLEKYPIVARVNKVADPAFENRLSGPVSEGIIQLPDQVESGTSAGRKKDLHDTGGSYASSEVWDKSENLLISTDPSDFATYPYKGVITGFDSGLVANANYHVSSNRFRVRVGFVQPKSAYALDDIVPVSARLLRGSEINSRTRVLAIQAPPSVAGAAGVHPDFPFTQIVDVPDKSVVGTPDLTTGTVSGTMFRVELANYSNAFEMMTTGTVSAAIRVEFTGTVGTTAISSYTYVGANGALYLPSSLSASVSLKTSAPDFDFVEVDGRRYRPKDFQYLKLTDARGNPRIFSPNIDWPFLDGKVGQMKIRVWYKDEKDEIITPVEATATVDSAMPTNTARTGPPTLFLETLSPKKHVDRGADGASWTYDTAGPLAAGITRWTSSTDVRATYDARDDGDIFREHTDSLSGPHSGIPAAVAVDSAHDGAANSGPDDGSRPGRLAKWKLIKPGSQNKSDLVSEPFTLVGSDAPKELNFRFRDANFNIYPEPPPPPPDPGPPTAGTVRETVYLDRTPPKLEYVYFTTSPVSPQYVNSLRKLKIVTEVNPSTAFWTNDTQPRFQWKFTDPGFAAGSLDSGVGVKGINITLSQSGGASAVPLLFPVQHVPDTAGVGLGVDVDLSHPSSRITSFAPDGLKTLTLQAVDALANFATPVTTDVWVDTTGPTLSVAAGKLQVRSAKLTRRTVLSPASGFTSESLAMHSASDLDLGAAMRVTDVRFQPVTGQLEVRNLAVKSGATILASTLLSPAKSSTLTTFAPFVWQVPAGADGKHPLANKLQYDVGRVGAGSSQYYIEVGGYDESTGAAGGWVDATALTTASTATPLLDLSWQEIEAFASDGRGIGVSKSFTGAAVADAVEWRYRWSGGVGGQAAGNASLATEEGDLAVPTKNGFALPANSFRTFALAGRDRLTNIGPFATFFTFRYDASEPVPVLTLKPKLPPVFSVGASFFTSVMTFQWNDVDDVPDPATLASYRVYFHHSGAATFVSTATVSDTATGNSSFVYTHTHPLLPGGADDDTNTYTIRGVDRYGTEQQLANNQISVYYDHTTPTIDPFHTKPTSVENILWTTKSQALNLARSTHNLRITTGDKYYWTNVLPVRFSWVGRDLALFSKYRPHTEEGSGVKGYNTAFPDGPALTQPPLTFPPAIASASGATATRDESTQDPKAGGKDGAKTFTVQGVDMVGNRSTLYTTTYWLDTTGPTIQTNKLDLRYTDNRHSLRPATALPITTVTSASSMTLAWAQIQTAAVDGAGVGVHNTDKGKSSADATEWQYRYELQQSTGSPPVTVSPTASTASPTFNYTFAAASTASITLTTAATQLVLAIDKLGGQSVQTMAIASVALYALDRLTNVGTPVQIVKLFRDAQPPNPLLSLSIPTPTSSVVAMWDNVTDVGNAGTDTGWFRVYRSALAAMATPAPLASRVSTLRTTSPFDYPNRYLGTRPATSQASALAGVGDAGRRTQDGLHYFRVQPVDNIGNEQEAGNVTVPILFDTTEPVADRLDWKVASAPPIGTLTISRKTTQSAGVDWTNDTRPNFLWRGQDLALSSTVLAKAPGSGVLGSNYTIVDGLTGATPSSTMHVQVTTGDVTFQSYGQQGPATSVFSILVPIRSPAPLDRDGAKTFQVNAIDRLGFVATPVTTKFYLDTTGPTLVPSQLGLRVAYFNGTPAAWQQTVSSVTSRPWASVTRFFPTTIAVSDLSVVPSSTEPVDLRKFFLYRDGVQVASLGDLTDTVPFLTRYTTDDIPDGSTQNVVTALGGTYTVTKVTFTLARTGANPSNIQFSNVKIRPASGGDVVVSSPTFTISTAALSQVFTGSWTGASLVFDRRDFSADSGCANCDTDYVVKVEGTRFGHTSANAASWTTPVAIFANKIQWDHQEPYSGAPNPGYTLRVDGRVDQGLATASVTPAAFNVNAGVTSTGQSISFTPMIVNSISIAGSTSLQVKNVRLRIAANNVDDTTGTPGSYSALPRTVTPSNIWADRVFFDIKNTGGSTLGATFTISGTGLAAPVFNPPGGSTVSVGEHLPPTNALTLRAFWNPIQTSHVDGPGIGLDSAQAQRWSYMWTSTAANAPQDLSADQSDLPLPPSSTCNYFQLAGRDKLTNRGPFDLAFQLSLDNIAPTISTFSAFRNDAGAETDITSLDGTWIATNVVRYAFTGTDQNVNCGTVTGVQLRGWSYTFGEGAPGARPDTSIDPVTPLTGHSAGSASVTTSFGKPGGASRVLRLVLVDKAGNPSLERKFTVNVDTEKPSSTVTPPPIALDLAASGRTVLATHFPSGVLVLTGTFTETISTLDPQAEPQPTPADLRISTNGGVTFDRFTTLGGALLGQGVGQPWSYNWKDPRHNSVPVTLVASATDQAGNNTLSTTVAVFVDTVLAAPVVTVSAPTPTNDIRISWNNTFGGDPSGPGSYRVYRNTTQASIGSVVATTAATPANPNLYRGTQPINPSTSLPTDGTKDGTYFFTIRPVDIPGNETPSGNTTSPLLYDTTQPEVDNLGWKLASSTKTDGTVEGTTITRITTAGSSANWTNETTPTFLLRARDLSRFSTVVSTATSGSGVAGINFTLAAGTVAALPSGVSPTAIPTAPLGVQTPNVGTVGPGTAVFELSRNTTPRVPALGGDGPKTLAFRAVDRVNLASVIDSRSTTTFWFDTTGPVLKPTAFGGTVSFASATTIDQSLKFAAASEGTFVPNLAVPLVAPQYVSAITLTPVGGAFDFRNITLKDGPMPTVLSAAGLAIVTAQVTGVHKANNTAFAFTADQDLAQGLEVTSVRLEYTSGTGSLQYKVVRLLTSNGTTVSPDVSTSSGTLAAAGSLVDLPVGGLAADKVKVEFADPSATNTDKNWRISVTGRRIRRNDGETMTFNLSPAIKADSVTVDYQDVQGGGKKDFTVAVTGKVGQSLQAATRTLDISPVVNNTVYSFSLPKPMLASSLTISAAGGTASMNDVTFLRSGYVVAGGSGNNIGALPATYAPKAVWIDQVTAKVSSGPPTAPLRFAVSGQELGTTKFGLSQPLSVGQTLPPTNAFSLLVTFNDVQTSLDDGVGVGTLNSQPKRWTYKWNIDGAASPVATSAASIELPLPLGTQCASLELAGRDRLTNLGPFAKIFTITIDNTPPGYQSLVVRRRLNNSDVTSLAQTWIETNRLNFELTGTDTALSCQGNTIQLRGWSYTFGQGLPGEPPDVSIETPMDTAGSVTVLGPDLANGQNDVFRSVLIDAGGNFSSERGYIVHIDTEFPQVALAASPFSKSRPVASSAPLLLSTHFPVTITGTFAETVSSVSRTPGNTFPPQNVSDVELRLEASKFYGYTTLSPADGLSANGSWTFTWPLGQVAGINGVGAGGNGRIDIVPRATDQANNVTLGTTVPVVVDVVLPAALGVASLARVSPATVIDLRWPNTFDSPAPKDPSGPGKYSVYRLFQPTGVPVGTDYTNASFVAMQDAVASNLYLGHTALKNAGDKRLATDGSEDGHYYFTIHPVDTPDGFTPGNENSGLTTQSAIRFDTTSPTIAELNWNLATANRNRTTTQPNSHIWTNETTPTLTWKGFDLARLAARPELLNRPGAGLAGSNFALAGSFAVPNPSSALPALVPTASFVDLQSPSAGTLGPSTSAFVLSGGSIPRVPGLGSDGPKSFAIRTLDRVALASTALTTQFVLDTTAPTPVTSVTVSAGSGVVNLGNATGPGDGSGIIRRIAGTGSSGEVDIRDGSAATASTLTGLRDVAAAPDGSVWFTDDASDIVGRVDSAGTLKTMASVRGPGGLALDGAGNCFVARPAANKVVRIDAVTRIVTDVPFTGLSSPRDCACDRSGNVYVADTGNDRVRKWNVSTRLESTFGPALQGARSLAFDSADNLFVARDSSVTKLTPAGSASSVAAADVDSVASDSAGGLYGVVTADHTLLELPSENVLAGKQGAAGSEAEAGDGGPAASALLNQPVGVAVDGSGELLLADRGLFRLRRIGRGGQSAPPGRVGVRTAYTLSWPGSSDGNGVGGITYDLLSSLVGWVANRTPASFDVTSITGNGTQRELVWEVEPLDLLGGMSNPSINRRTEGNQLVTVVEDLKAPPATTASITAPKGRSISGTFYTSGDFTVSWGAVADGAQGSGLAGYTVNRNGSGYTRLASSVTALPELQSALADTSYQYEIVAEDRVGNTGTGNVMARAFLDTVLPAAVTVTTATTAGITGTDALPATSSQVAVTWTTAGDAGFPATGSGTVNYLVNTAVAPPGSSLTTQTVALTPRNYTDTRGGLLDGLFDFTVRAIDRASNVSARVAEDTVRIRLDRTVPSAVTMSDVTTVVVGGAPPIPVTSSQVQLSWTTATDSGSGLREYRLFRSVNSDAQGPRLAYPQLPGLGFTDTRATGDGTYYYTMDVFDRAYNVSPLSTWGRSPGARLRVMLDRTAPSSLTPTFLQGDGALGGFVSTVVSSGLSDPRQLAFGPDGNLYVANTGGDNVKRISPGGTVTTLTLTGQTIDNPEGVAVAPDGTVYISNTSRHCIVKFTGSGSVLFAGVNAASGGSTEGAPGTGKLNSPRGIAVDAQGNVYIADQGNDKIRKATPAGTLSTVLSGLGDPYGVAVRGGLLYFTEVTGSTHRVTKCNLDGTSRVVIAGSGSEGFSGDGGLGVDCQLDDPRQIAVDGTGAVYIADRDNKRVRRWNASDSIISTIGGDGGTSYGGDGVDATATGFDKVNGVALDAAGFVVVALSNNNRIVRIAPSGTSPGTGATPISKPFDVSWPASSDSTGI
ncbi:MAG: PKD domain-containing protein, partial [Candidatus Wallbacteria bacterium]|nr:PKD domain-containing protein [Candidatus Wallbacteria bacterium]